MLNRMKLGVGVALLALLVAVPLAAGETPEAELQGPVGLTAVTSIMTCGSGEPDAESGGCPDEADDAAAEAAAAACMEIGGFVKSVTVRCTYLGSGWWSWTADVVCQDPM